MFAKIELRAEQSIKDIDTFEQYSAVVVGFKNYSELNGIDKSLTFFVNICRYSHSFGNR